MDDSDDYFRDFSEPNDDDLAALENEEEKFEQSIATKTQKLREASPPSKRQKLLHEAEESDELFDVFLQPNGLYGIAPPRTSVSPTGEQS
jgi:hypothetical protein